MSTVDRTLMALAAITVGAGIALGAWSGSEDVGSALKSRWGESFAEAPWSASLPVGAGLAGLALVASGASFAANRFRKKAEPRSPFAVRKPAEIVAEVQARLRKAMGKSEPDAIGACETLISGAIHLRASDLHLSPGTDDVQVTYRVDGELLEVVRLPMIDLPPLITRFKVLSKLDTYVKTAPQDGRLSAEIDGVGIEARVSTLPTERGERIVLRFVRGNREVPEIHALGFSGEVSRGLADLTARPQGLLFVTGPVGSGKTTTLYSCLQHIQKTRGRTTTLVTLEDPIEIEIPFATQTQIHAKSGMTFASALRSVLRQDPNVLMLGEIRDRETAEIAMQAGLTGHLIVTTVHGQSASGVFARLIEMDVEPFLLASATLGALSQRLVRMLCPLCKRVHVPDATMIGKFAALGVTLGPGTFYEPVGCETCDGQGFQGRLPIAELLVAGDAVKNAVKARAATSEIEKVARGQAMTTLVADGARRAERGETSLLEVLRVAG